MSAVERICSSADVHADLNYIVDTGAPPVRYIDWPETAHAEGAAAQ